MSNLQLDFTESELLASQAVVEPLFAAGQRCHGGFAIDGSYVSPRTQYRWPAIRQWQHQHTEVFGTPILDAPLDQWPAQFPNVAQTKFLIQQGITEPTAATLTRIGTVEGFGGVIREVGIGNLQPHFDDSIAHTALAHLEVGLFEAHARDEVGYGDEAGHKEMWFATRDIAFDRAFSASQIEQMVQRMAVTPGAGESAAPVQLCPEIDPALEVMLRFMIGLMFIEVSAFHAFAWAEEVLSDTDLVAGDGVAARLVSYIRADETPHVAYLQTALTEVRDRMLRTVSGGTVAGSAIIERCWNHSIAESLGPRRDLQRNATLSEIKFALRDVARGPEILEHFHALATT